MADTQEAVKEQVETGKSSPIADAFKGLAVAPPAPVDLGPTDLGIEKFPLGEVGISVTPPAPKVEVMGSSDIDALKAQMAMLAEVVSKQQEKSAQQDAVFEKLAEEGMRKSDIEAHQAPGLAAIIEMGPQGFVVKLRGAWTMGNINQVRMAMRQALIEQMGQAARDLRQSPLRHRKTGASLVDVGGIE